jgi:integrase/recombinase XerD
MKLREGISLYVEVRQSEGTLWSKGAKDLTSLCRHIGDVPLDRIRVDQVASFLDGSLTGAATWYHKYSALRLFFRYWKVHQEILTLPLPPARSMPEQTFVPYVYPRSEVQRLLRATMIVQRRLNCVIDARTFRTLLLFLYGTGAMIGEALQLECHDVNLRRRRITLHSNRCFGMREIPMGADLHDILRRYKRTHHPKGRDCDSKFFLTTHGSGIGADTANQTFQRVRKEAGIARHDGGRYQPRMLDLRHTFAVHRLTSWLKHGADMGRMIPALSAYMGLHDLGRAERYLQLAPERFRAQLDKLSPQRPKRRWRDDPELMRFLDSL